MPSLKMSVSDWIAVRDNPRQRDTERHAAKAKHLLTPAATHRYVAAAKLPNGHLIKLDGHTRALLWSRHAVARPSDVEVTIIPVKTEEEAKALYGHYDSTNALETATDKISGSFNEIGFTPESALLRSGRIGSALRIAWVAVKGWGKEAAAKDTYEMVNEFAAEILALDEMRLPKAAAQGGVIAAFLLCYKRYGEECRDFWRAVFANAGTKINGQMDGVQALNELMAQRRGMHGGSAMMDMCCRALHAYEKYRNDEMLSIIPRPLNLTGYLTKKPTQRSLKIVQP